MPFVHDLPQADVQCLESNLNGTPHRGRRPDRSVKSQALKGLVCAYGAMTRVVNRDM